MRELIERFAGHYQIWRDEQRVERSARDTNPLNPLAFVVVAFFAFDVYKICRSYYVDWRMVESALVNIPFLILYIRKSPLAWLVLPIWLVTFVLYLPTAYMRIPAGRPHWPVMSFMFGFFLAGVIWAFFLRRSYAAYLERYRAEKTSDI